MFLENTGLYFDNSYLNLPKVLYSESKPERVPSPELVAYNEALANDIDIISDIPESYLSQIFSGQVIPKGAYPISQAYAGHQFGNFAILGDGRAILLGEHIDKKNNRWDIQFKGSGETIYSRRGDGKATLPSMLREYIISEAMHYLNIPTTRSLAVVKTGEKIIRDKFFPGAILTRVAQSHIRVGTFEFTRWKTDSNIIKHFTDYVIDRHYPEISKIENKYLEFIKEVMKKQISLVVNWMRVGFIHGVMNTDNMSISGETIDYGPCAFMDSYDPETVFSSIDVYGRYAYTNQPWITKWNLARLSETILKLIDPDMDKAIAKVTEALDDFNILYQSEFQKMMNSKLGLTGNDHDDKDLTQELLDIMESNKMDFTNTFRSLTSEKYIQEFENVPLKNWLKKWDYRRSKNNISLEQSMEIMRKNNPLVIPRNHHVERVLKETTEGNLESLKQFMEVLRSPYEDNFNSRKFTLPPQESENVYKTYCGT